MHLSKVLKSFFSFFIILLCCQTLCYAGKSNTDNFTIGIYGVNNPQDIKIVKEAGFNTIQTYKKDYKTIKALAKEAKKQKIELLVFPDNLMDKIYQKEAVDYPVKAWYLCDEPEVKKISSSTLKITDRKVRKNLPGHKTALVIGSGKTKIPYYDIADILMVDWYPVPHLPLESFGEQIHIAREELNKVKNEYAQLWAVVQMFDWSEDKQSYNGKDIIPRFPAKNEIRFMSYDALFNGATGLFYFTFRSMHNTLPNSRPNEWEYIKEIINELDFTSKVFTSGKSVCTPICDKNNKCSVCGTGTFNITGNESFIKIKTFDYNGSLYTFIINPSKNPQTLPKIFFEKRFDILFESDTNPSKIIMKSKNNCKPYSVYVFRHN